MDDEFAGKIAALLDMHHVMSLATIGPNGPHAVNLFYAPDGFTLLWVSDPSSRHSVDIDADSRVAATIAADFCKEHRHLRAFSKRTTLRKSMYETVASRWGELGLPGQVPQVRAFEQDSKVVYHEIGDFEPGPQPGEEKS